MRPTIKVWFWVAKCGEIFYESSLVYPDAVTDFKVYTFPEYGKHISHDHVRQMEIDAKNDLLCKP